MSKISQAVAPHAYAARETTPAVAVPSSHNDAAFSVVRPGQAISVLFQDFDGQVCRLRFEQVSMTCSPGRLRAPNQFPKQRRHCVTNALWLDAHAAITVRAE